MKIMHLLFSNQYSGAENVVCQIIEKFREVPDIEMVYCSRSGPIGHVLEERGIEFIPVESFSFFGLKRVISAYKPDLIHAHDFLASMFAAVCSGKIPVISHLHNNAPWMKSYGAPAIAYGLMSKRFASILTVSESVFDEYVMKDKISSKPIVVGNPVNIPQIRGDAEKETISETFDICFCGRLTKQKNPPFLLEIVSAVCRELPETSVVLIGDGEMRDVILSKIKELHLEKNVTVAGFLLNRFSVMKNSTLMLFPSLWEGYGLVAVESIALGVPVVCSNAGGLPNIVNETCGKVCIHKEEYVDEIVKLLSDSEYLKAKKTGCKIRAKELNNIEQYCQTLSSVYRG